MGTKAQHTRPIDPDFENRDLVSWFNQQIKTGDFSAISSWLENSESKSTGSGVLPDIRQSAIQLCHICQNHQEEMDASWNAYQRGVAQEKALSANLLNLLHFFIQKRGNEPLLITSLATPEKRPFPSLLHKYQLPIR